MAVRQTACRYRPRPKAFLLAKDNQTRWRLHKGQVWRISKQRSSMLRGFMPTLYVEYYWFVSWDLIWSCRSSLFSVFCWEIYNTSSMTTPTGNEFAEFTPALRSGQNDPKKVAKVRLCTVIFPRKLASFNTRLPVFFVRNLKQSKSGKDGQKQRVSLLLLID